MSAAPFLRPHPGLPVVDDVAAQHGPRLRIAIPRHPPLDGRETGHHAASSLEVPAEVSGDAVGGGPAVP